MSPVNQNKDSRQKELSFGGMRNRTLNIIDFFIEA